MNAETIIANDFRRQTIQAVFHSLSLNRQAADFSEWLEALNIRTLKELGLSYEDIRDGLEFMVGIKKDIEDLRTMVKIFEKFGGASELRDD